MSDEAINKLIIKAVASINTAIDLLEQCIEEDEDSTDDMITLADELENICVELRSR